MVLSWEDGRKGTPTQTCRGSIHHWREENLSGGNVNIKSMAWSIAGVNSLEPYLEGAKLEQSEDSDIYA